MYTKPALFAVLCIFNLTVSIAQNTLLNDNALKFYDEVTGIENSKLYNGKRYYDTYKISADNHAFFKSPKYVKSALVFDNQTYFNVNLKYDIFNDVLVSKPTDKKSLINLELSKSKIRRFTIKNHTFINTNYLFEDPELSGFVELLSSKSNFQFLIKNRKEVKQRIKNNKTVYNFFEVYEYYLFRDKVLHKIKNYKSLKKILPKYNKAISTFYQSNKKKMGTDKHKFMMKLLKHIDYAESFNNNLKSN